jgi:hypothetical protein
MKFVSLSPLYTEVARMHIIQSKSYSKCVDLRKVEYFPEPHRVLSGDCIDRGPCLDAGTDRYQE